MPYSPAGNQVGTGSLSEQATVYYDRRGLDKLKAMLRFVQICTPKPLPKQAGRTIQFYRFTVATSNTTPAVDGVVGAAIPLASNTLSATVEEYNDFTSSSTLLEETMSSEYETAEFIAGLVRLTKPGCVVETGCHKGLTTVAIAAALRKNGHGNLYACDISAEHCQHVRELLSNWPMDLAGGRAEVRQCKGVEMIESLLRIDMAFIDSGDDKHRFEEIRALSGKLSKGAIVLLHDARRQCFVDACAWLYEYSLTFFDTPRGLAMWQRT